MPAQSVQDILATHAIDNLIWDLTDECEVSIDTVNRTEALAASHIVEQLSEYILCRPDPIELLTTDAYVPPDSNEDDRMYQCMDNYNKWDKSPNTAGVNDIGSSYTSTAVTSGSANKLIKSDFWIFERQS